MKNKSIKLILGLLMLAALGGGLLLVKQNQNPERGAYFAGTDLSVLPTAIKGTVGSTVPVAIYVTTKNGAKLSSVDMKVCYGDDLSLKSDPTSQIVLNKSALGELVSAEIVGSCVRIVATASLSTKPEDLKSGAIKLLTIRFLAKSKGTGDVKINKTTALICGYNPANSDDSALKVGTVTGATYTITDGGSLSPTPTGGILKCYCKTGCTSGNCKRLTAPSGDFKFSCSDARCVLPTLTPTPTTPATGNEPILNYKVSFGDVKLNSSVYKDTKCAINWPLQIIVLSAGKTKVYTDVIAREVGSSGALMEYKGKLTLTGFDYFKNIAVFIKGPKHLQMKYAIQDQKSSYDKAGGALTLTDSATTSPLYNFTGYAMLPGDVVGATVDSAPNGEINGVDFAYVKTKAKTHESVAEGGYLQADLDGNCQLNTVDLVILKKSLETKQGELY